MANVRRIPQPTRTIPITTPAPYKGLNTIDSLAMMAPEYGLSIQNFIASPQGLKVREGYRTWATNLPAAVTTLISYNGKTAGSSKLFAVSGSAMYDVTSGGDMSGATPVITGLSSSAVYWQYTSQTHTASSVNRLFAVNGTNTPRMYDGTSWSSVSQSAGPWTTPGQFSSTDNNGNSVSMASFCDVTLHYQRLWFVRNDSTIGYYCGIGAAGGQLYAFDFGPNFSRGGKLHKLASWTIDSGSGTSSLLVAISDRGDVVVYGGNDPSSASTWSLVGTYKLGAPVGRRCTAQLQGDLLVLTTDGLYAMSKFMQSQTLDRSQALTYLIQPTISSLTATLYDTPGFEVFVHSAADLLLLNVPQLTQTNNFQFCFNTIQQGWTQFTGWPAACFALFNEAAYFGGTNFVALAFIGYKDGATITGDNGDNLVATALTAFNSFSSEGLGPGLLKHVKMVKPFIVTGQSNPTLQVGVNVDFNLIPIIGAATVNPVTGAVWDNAYWDNGSTTWVGSLTTFNEWSTPLSNPGTYMAFALAISAVSETLWASTNWIVSPSGQQLG